MIPPEYHDKLRKFVTTDAQFNEMSALIADLIADETASLRKQRDQALQRLNQSGVLVVTLNKSGMITFINDEMCALLGYAPDEVMGENWFNIALPKEVSDKVFEQFLRVMADDKMPSTTYENEVITKSGQRHLIAWHNTYDRDVETGDIIGSLSSGRNITIQRATENMLHANELRYREMFYANNAIKLVIDPATDDIIDANQAACNFYGYDYDHLTQMNIGQINVMSVSELAEHDGRIPIEGSVYRYQHRIASGEIKEVEVYTGPLTIDEQVFRYSVILDVTERERAKKQLELSELQFRTVVENFSGALIMFDRHLRAIIARGQLHIEQMTPLKDIEGMLLENALQEELWHSLQASFQMALEGYPIRRNVDYEQRYYVEQIKPMYDHNGQLIGGLYMLDDVTDMYESEQLLIETKQQLTTILDGILDGVAIIAANESILYANDEAAHILGYESSQHMMDAMQDNLYIHRVPINEQGELMTLEDQSVYHALHGETPAPEILAFQDVETKQSIWAEVKANPIFNQAGEVQFVVVILTDITHAREMEHLKLKALKEQAQVETLRKYIANTTHDIAQPLSVINTAVYMLDRMIDDDSVQRRTQSIQAQTTRIQSILEDIQQISVLDTMTSLEFIPVDMSDLISGVVTTYQTITDARQITLNTDIQPVSSILYGNPSYIHQALKQVIQNAIDYTDTKGFITIRGYDELHNYVIEVRDTGVGIPADAIERITERFYRVDESRTMSPRSGTGLGLSITKRIMDLHGGEISIKSIEKNGTTVSLLFPITP